MPLKSLPNVLCLQKPCMGLDVCTFYGFIPSLKAGPPPQTPVSPLVLGVSVVNLIRTIRGSVHVGEPWKERSREA